MRKSSGWPFLASEFCSASASAIRRWLALTITRSQGQKPACKDLSRNGQTRPSRPRPLILRFLSGPVHAHFILGGSRE
ncbi:hypothetical protein HMPREF0541_02244 [Lacticaseibacillus rhamnosus ATCC 21052]|nr:hypothetical protein HMPREF0541_02244 [Lacticaseibacillus rhamnosus ATCC 21052]